MKYRLWLSAVLLAAVACDASEDLSDPAVDRQFAKNAGTTPSWLSTGKVDIVDPFRPENSAFYKYHAKSDKNGTKGTFSYETGLYAGPLVSSGDVVCMTVIVLPDGTRKARFGGIVTSSNRPEIPVDHEFVWSVTDDNPRTGQVETASPLLGLQETGFAQRYCANGLPYPESPVEPGHIHIHQTGSGS